jgi:hypothetical protein
MGEFLVAIVAIPSIRRIRALGPYENMAWSTAANDNSLHSLPLTIHLLELAGWAIARSRLRLVRPTVYLFFPSNYSVARIRTHV